MRILYFIVNLFTSLIDYLEKEVDNSDVVKAIKSSFIKNEILDKYYTITTVIVNNTKKGLIVTIYMNKSDDFTDHPYAFDNLVEDLVNDLPSISSIKIEQNIL